MVYSHSDPDRPPVRSSDRPRNSDVAGYLQPAAGPGSPGNIVAHAVRRRYKLVAAVLALTVIPAAYLAMLEQPSYTAEAMIRIADVRGSVTGTREAREEALGQRTDQIRSAMEIIRGWEVLGDVVDSEALRLTPEPGGLSWDHLADVEVSPDAPNGEIRLRFSTAGVTARSTGEQVRAAYGAPLELAGVRFRIVAGRPESERATLYVRSRDEAIASLRQVVGVRQLERTDLVVISHSASSPDLAQRVANAVVNAAREETVRRALERTQRRRIFLEEQVRGTDSLVAETQLTLIGFRSREQVHSSGERLAAQQQSLMSLDIRREEMNADRAMFQSLINALQRPGQAQSQTLRTLVSSPGIAQNAVVVQLYNQLVQYETERDALTTGPTGSTAEHPAVVRLNGLIASTQARLVDAISSHVSSLDARLQSLDVLRARSASELRTMPGAEVEEMRLVQQLGGLTRMQEQLREELHNARMTEAVGVGQVEVLNFAPYPAQSASRRSLKLALAGMLGLTFGVGSALVSESGNRSFRRRDDMEHVLHLPGLAVVPFIPGPRGGTGQHRKLRFSSETRGSKPNAKALLGSGPGLETPGLEAYRTLRTNLIFSQDGHAPRTLVVTSATKGDGKSTTAAHVAMAFAAAGKRVLLVDCDARRPQLHRLLGVPKAPGLIELLHKDVIDSDVIRRTIHDGVFVLTAGKLETAFAEHLESEAMRDAVERFGARFDLVIFDSPPVLGSADPTILAPLVEGVVLVVRMGRTNRAAARHAAQQLERVGARILGVVLNDPEAVLPDHEGYVTDYYYAKQ